MRPGDLRHGEAHHQTEALRADITPAGTGWVVDIVILHMKPMHLFLTVVCAMVLAACGSPGGSTGLGEPVDGSGQPAESVAADDPSAVELASTCGYVKLGTAQDPILPDAPLSATARAALDPYIGETEGEFGFFSGYEWFLAEESASEIILFGVPLSGASEGYADVLFESTDGSWTPAGWGTCHPTVGVESDSIEWGLATWILDPDTPPDPDSTSIPVLINERNCANGEPPVGREVVAQAVEDDDSVVITVLVEPVPGMANCPGNPWHRTVLELGTAPGGRPLFDGSVTPAEERTWPPSHPDFFGSVEP